MHYWFFRTRHTFWALLGFPSGTGLSGGRIRLSLNDEIDGNFIGQSE
jgi:hypothetical protein